MKINEPINTPAGPGIYLGEYEIRRGDFVEFVHLVEMPVTDSVIPFMKNENCLMPRCRVNTKFVFTTEELG